ncbi:DUF1116 domain-containing protein [Roseibium sp. RKSG952]|uniref:DUF1116 domain-containing protein n=1 Tax=Roseibium sp. RKSG952 TaxID=2529384 RepID=UPI0012BC0DB7|nr:DUF1116 domain-containing protein [Roseibium sp. RKSG952]MTH96804.1 DUF1116 domain-containing protein [Roseibium sp. RKSG952]
MIQKSLAGREQFKLLIRPVSAQRPEFLIYKANSIIWSYFYCLQNKHIQRHFLIHPNHHLRLSTALLIQRAGQLCEFTKRHDLIFNGGKQVTIATDSYIRPDKASLLARFQDPACKHVVSEANKEVINRMRQSRPLLVGTGKARDHIPGMKENTVLHAGPPLTWKDANAALRGAIIGGLIFEGLAKNKDEAMSLARSGKIELACCHDHSAVGPMAGIITSSMSVFIMEDQTSGERFYSNISDDLGDHLDSSLRFGVYEQRAIDHLYWIEEVLAPALNAAIVEAGDVDMVPIIGHALMMGDNCHVTLSAASLLFLKELTPGLIKHSKNSDNLLKIMNLIHNDALFALNPVMATCKAISAAGSNVDHSSIVTVMARNGTEFGLKVSGLGDQWFTGISAIGQGVLASGLAVSDVGRDIGDSAITETLGLGGVAKSIFGSVEEVKNITEEMYQVTYSESEDFRIPGLNGRGAPLGFDILKIVELGIRPLVNTGLVNRQMNKYSAGVGYLYPPMDVFVDAVMNLNERYE